MSGAKRRYYVKAGDYDQDVYKIIREDLTKTEALECIRAWVDDYDWVETGEMIHSRA